MCKLKNGVELVNILTVGEGEYKSTRFFKVTKNLKIGWGGMRAMWGLLKTRRLLLVSPRIQDDGGAVQGCVLGPFKFMWNV